jgi:hypothetical protein
MSTTLIVATRELRERSRLLVVAAALAILPFAVALAPGARGNRSQVIMIIGASLAINYAFALALAMGVSTIGRDLSEKRLSFYFSKPISPLALWTGKAGASLLIAITSALIIAAPSYLATREAWRAAWMTNGVRLAPALLAALILLFFGSHAIGTMVRSRSGLVALDLVLAVTAAAAIAAIVRPILLGGGKIVAIALGCVLGAGILLILMAAPVWQLGRGRTDTRRSHAALSMFLWSAMGILLVIAAAYVAWLRSAAPSDLVEVREIEQAPTGGWAVVVGVGAHRGDFHSAFLMNAATGQSSRFATPPWGGVTWSRDGRVVAWIEPEGWRQDVWEVHVQAMETGENRASGIRVGGWCGLVLSDDGSRVAVDNDGIIAVHDLVNHRVMASVRRVPTRSWMFFVTNDVLRIVDFVDISRQDVGTLRVSELDVRTRKFATLGRRPGVTMKSGWVSASNDASRLFLRTMGEIVEGRTLAPRATVAAEAGWGSTMLGDGSVIIIDRENGVRLRFFDRDGQPRGELALPNVRFAYVSGETRDGKVLISAAASVRPLSGRSMIIVDRTRLVIERVVPDVIGPFPTPRIPRYAAGESFVSGTGEGKLKVWR